MPNCVSANNTLYGRSSNFLNMEQSTEELTVIESTFASTKASLSYVEPKTRTGPLEISEVMNLALSFVEEACSI